VFKYQKYSNPANLYSSKNFNAFALGTPPAAKGIK
jgi:hypothetical protein